VKIDWIAGAVVERDGEEHRLGQVPGAHSVFPTGTQLGVRVEALEAYIQQMPPKAADALDKPLKERERTTLLSIIAALAVEADIDLSHPSTAASSVVARLQLMGIRLGQTTVESHLKKAIEASEKLKK
jgi:hypothetical protein